MKTMSLMALLLAVRTGARAASLPAAEVKMKNVDGKEVRIADVAGTKGTLVIFSCNHCPFVKAWEKRIVEIGKAALAQGIGVIQINPNDPAKQPPDSFEEMQKRAKERGFAFPYVVDATSDVTRAYGATRTPEVFLYDAAGNLVYTGAVDDDKEEAQVTKRFLQDAIAAVVAGKPVETKSTKSVGCTIKWREKQS
jgi:peroxiredoxin